MSQGEVTAPVSPNEGHLDPVKYWKPFNVKVYLPNPICFLPILHKMASYQLDPKALFKLNWLSGYFHSLGTIFPGIYETHKDKNIRGILGKTSSFSAGMPCGCEFEFQLLYFESSS